MARDRKEPSAAVPAVPLRHHVSQETSNSKTRGFRGGVIDWLENPDEEGTQNFIKILNKALEDGDINSIVGLMKEAMRETPNVQIAILGGNGLTIPANITTDPEDWYYEGNHGLKLHKATIDYVLTHGDGVPRHSVCRGQCIMLPRDERKRKDVPIEPIEVKDEDAIGNE